MWINNPLQITLVSIPSTLVMVIFHYFGQKTTKSSDILEKLLPKNEIKCKKLRYI